MLTKESYNLLQILLTNISVTKINLNKASIQWLSCLFNKIKKIKKNHLVKHKILNVLN